MIQLARLEGFYWVGRTSGYSRAARAFPYPITQPGVHQQVRKLETELGLRLFERAGHDRVRLTAAGQALYDFAAPFFEQLPAMVRAMRAGDFGGTLRIHAPGHILRNLLPAWLRALRADHPRIEIDLIETGTADLELLRRCESDLLIDHLPSVPEDIATLEVGMVRSFIVLPARHPLAKRRGLTLSDLSDERFIAYHPDRAHHDRQMQALALFNVVPRSLSYADTSDTIIGMVAAGLGFSVVPSLHRKGPQSPDVVARVVRDPRAEFRVYAAWRKNAPANPLLKAALSLAPRVEQRT